MSDDTVLTLSAAVLVVNSTKKTAFAVETCAQVGTWCSWHQGPGTCEGGLGKTRPLPRKSQSFPSSCRRLVCSVWAVSQFQTTDTTCLEAPPSESFPAAAPNLSWATYWSLPKYCGSSPSSLSSYSTRNPDTVSEAETQETTKLLAVISVTDSEVATRGERGVVSPVTVLPRESQKGASQPSAFWKMYRPCCQHHF